MPQDPRRRAVLLVGAVTLGALLGFLAARVVLVGSAWSLVPWALAGLAVGAVSTSSRSAALAGALYGFALAYAFMVAGYDGSSPLHTRLAPFVVFGAVGAVCGATLALIGRAMTLRRRRRTTEKPPEGGPQWS